MSRSFALTAIIALAACGGSDDEKYAKCDNPVAITVTNQDILDEYGWLMLPKGIETDIGLAVTDAEGDLCDPSGLDFAFDDPQQLEVGGSDDAFILKPLYDAIDLGTEPGTVMHVSLEDLHASWNIVSIVALGGTWDVVITETSRFPDGYQFGNVTFTQLGRRMRWEDCTISLVCERDAVIVGQEFTVEAPDIGLSIAAPIASDRRSFSGPWSAMDGDYSGEFTAQRVGD